MAKKELTPRESRRNLTLSTLERKLNQNVLGANLASDVAQYGKKGKENAQTAFNNKEIKNAREEQYKELSQRYEQLGVAGEPSYPSNSDISYKIIKGLEQTLEQSYLEDIAEGVNKFAPGLKFKLPDKLKGYMYSEIMQKAAEENNGKVMLNPEKLNKDEQTALEIYDNLREAYRLTAAKNVMDSNYLGKVKKRLDTITEKYNPTKKQDK